MGKKKLSRKKYENQDECKRIEAGKKLSKIVKPFVLRRKKSEVLKDLPEKEEINLLIELSGEHRKMYDAAALAVRQDKETQSNSIHALAALMRLRQIACSPKMINPTNVEGDKLCELRCILGNAIESGRRMIIFSQFVELLSIVQNLLKEEEISYQYLDGQTKNRIEVVERFQNGTDPVFLISLKAGGVGLNITSADMVIHLDSWWNPSVENQATDRSHRIGQTKKVTVYRLIAKDTVEEKIQVLKQKKQDIADSILENGISNSSLTLEEINNLLDLNK